MPIAGPRPPSRIDPWRRVATATARCLARHAERPVSQPRYGTSSGQRLRTRRAAMPAGRPPSLSFMWCRVGSRNPPGRVSPEGTRITTSTTTRRIRPSAKTSPRAGFRRPRATSSIMVSLTVRLGAGIGRRYGSKHYCAPRAPCPPRQPRGPDRAATAGGAAAACARPAGGRQELGRRGTPILISPYSVRSPGPGASLLAPHGHRSFPNSNRFFLKRWVEDSKSRKI
jgi:hypothetical protein